MKTFLTLLLLSVPVTALADPVQQAYRTKVDELAAGYLRAIDGSEFFIPPTGRTMNYLDSLVIYQVAGDWRVCHDGEIYPATQHRATLDRKLRQDLKLRLRDIERLKECY